MQYSRDKKLLLTVYFCFYFAVFLFLGIGHRTLLQVHPVLFYYNRDLAELMLIGSGLPRFMIAHPASFAFADTLAFLLPIPLLGYAFTKDRFSPFLGWVFFVYLTLYLLLADLFWEIHHGPFILYILIALAFVTNREDRFYFILRGCRYYFLYIFVSAALWKTVRGAVFDGHQMSHILLLQHIDLLTTDCQTALCRFYAWLIGHPPIAQGLYIGAIVMESVFTVGFFTRRFDRLLLGIAVLFVAADLLVMRIPYWTLLLGGITLWMDKGRRTRAMVIYETTHHENLPALLDLSEARFSRVVVFLKESSYTNISGKKAPAERWPATEFIVQAAGCTNRTFIRRMFVFLAKHQFSHLHLSTLDNNLLFVAWRLGMTGNLRVSLTLHEINAWFAYPWRSLRDVTENLAKLILHSRVTHYSFFLPAMADVLRRRMPKATAVFIPSRFYQPPAATPSAVRMPPALLPAPSSTIPMPPASRPLAPSEITLPAPSHEAPLPAIPMPAPLHEAPLPAIPMPAPLHEAPLPAIPMPAPLHEAPLPAIPMPAPSHEAPPSAIPMPAPSQPASPSAPEQQRPFTIVIPGSVDSNRRDYGFVTGFFGPWLASRSSSDRPILLVILGDSHPPAATAIVAHLKALESPAFSVLAFPGGYVPESTYEQQLAAADLLWSPLRLHKLGSRNNPETYGQTTASGLTADLLLNNIPALVPEGLVLPDVFQAALLPYRSADEVGRLLDRLIDDDAWLAQLRMRISERFMFFSKENFYAAFDRLTQEEREEG